MNPSDEQPAEAPAVVIPTNEEVGRKIGLTHSSVSRIRSGERLPSIEVMSRIEEEYNWSVGGQVRARQNGTYKDEFELAIAGGPGADIPS